MRNMSTFIVTKTLPIVVLSLLTSSGCSLAEDFMAPGTISVSGSVSVPPALAVLPNGEWAGMNDELLVNGGKCESSESYSDITSGGQVTLKDGAGEIVAIGKLVEGVQDLGGRSLTAVQFFFEADEFPICKFTFQLDVPAGKDFYSLSIGDPTRSQFSYTEAELSQAVNITLGG